MDENKFEFTDENCVSMFAFPFPEPEIGYNASMQLLDYASRCRSTYDTLASFLAFNDIEKEETKEEAGNIYNTLITQCCMVIQQTVNLIQGITEDTKETQSVLVNGMNNLTNMNAGNGFYGEIVDNDSKEEEEQNDGTEA